MQVGDPAVLHTAARKRRRWLRRIRRALVVILAPAMVLVGVLLWSSQWGATFGGKIDGERRARIESSPNFSLGTAENPVETSTWEGDVWNDTVAWFKNSAERKPAGEVPLNNPDLSVFEPGRSSGVRFSWFGHSTVFLELDGTRVLIDPVWSDRASPFSILGPKRTHEMPVALSDLPEIDVVVISHDHYDHLDMAVVRELAPRGVVFAVPLGVGAHLERWDVPSAQIIELDWWDRAEVESLELIATPARHFSGRMINQNQTLWASWALIGPRSRVFYSGDTGPFDGFEKIGRDHGPFDLTIMKCGAYGDGWPDIHINGIQAVEAHIALQGRALLPVHWLTFDLALHRWAEPIEQVLETAAEHEVRVLTPEVGEVVDLRSRRSFDRWWRAIDPQ